MRMLLGVLAVLFVGCTTDFASSDARGDGSQGSDASADHGGGTGELGSEGERDTSRELGAAAESEHAAADRAPEGDVERANAERAAASGASVSATEGAAAGTTGPGIEGTASLCGERAVCVTPRTDAIEACRSAFPAFVAAQMLFDPTDCTLVPASTARAGSGAIRGVAFAMVAHAEAGEPMFAILEGDRGYDRVVYFMDIDDGISLDTDYAVDAVAIEDLVPGDALEAWVELSRTSHGSACLEPLTWETRRRDVAVCGIGAAGQTYCTPPIPHRFVEIESTYDYETGKSRRSGARRFALDVRFDGSEMVVRRTRGSVPQDFQSLLGRRTPETMTGVRY